MLHFAAIPLNDSHNVFAVPSSFVQINPRDELQDFSRAVIAERCFMAHGGIRSSVLRRKSSDSIYMDMSIALQIANNVRAASGN